MVAESSLASDDSKTLQANIWTEYGTRPLAMGNAFVSLADDENAFFYNVAGLAFQDASASFLPFELMMSTQSLSNLIEYISELSGAEDSTDGLLNLLDENIGEVNSFELRYSPWYFNGLFGFSPIIKRYGEAVVHRQPSLELQTGLEVNLPLSLAYAFFERSLALGATLNTKFIKGIDEYITAAAIEDYQNGEAESFDDYESTAVGVGVDVGLIYRKKLENKEIRAGLSWKNIGDMAFYKLGGYETPERDRASVNLGVSYRHFTESIGDYYIAVDAHSN